MSDANRCIAGQTFKFAFIAEESGTSNPKTSPTLAAADFRISINGGTLTALTNTPTNTPSGSAWVEVILAAAETTSAAAGGTIRFQAIDAAGNEWKYWGYLIPVYAAEQAATGDQMTLADNAITAAKIADGAIDAATFAAGAINATAIATDAIAATKVAADAVAKIQNGLATPTNITAGTITTVTNLTNAPTNGDLTATMKTSVTTAASSATPSVTVSDKTGFRLSSAGVQDIWDAMTSALTTVDSIGKLLVDNINATISSRLASGSYTAPPNVAAIRTEMDSNSTKLANLDTTVGSRLATASYTAPPTATQIRQEMDTNSTQLTAIATQTADILADTGTDGVKVASSSKSGYSLASDQSSVTIGTVNGLGTQAKADVNAEVVDALNVDTYAEPTSVPSATSSLAAKIRWLFTLSRNKVTQGATTQTLRNDADSATIATSPVSDDGTTMTRGEWS